MKILSIGLLVICFILSSYTGFSQGKNGQVQGYLKDAGTHELLSFATVMFEGTNNGVVSDDLGFYRFNSVAPGSYKMKVSYVGYQDTTLNIVVVEGKTLQKDVLLRTSSSVEEVVVTAQARGQVKAINTQITAKTIKNVVSEEKIRELPDANSAEALARLPGVSVSRQGGEATSIQIRGVSANTIYVNGMRLDGNLSAISSSMIGSIEVSKAFMADQDADVLGGSVDFKMREAPSGFKKDLWFRTGYNGFTKSFKMQDASVLLSDRFLDDKLGVMLSVSWDRKDRGRDNYAAGYEPVGSSANAEALLPVKLNGVTLTHTQNLNNRYGGTLFVDYKLNNGKVFLQSFASSLNSQNDYTDNNYSNTSDINYNTKSYVSLAQNFMNGIGGEHTLLGAKIDWGINYSNTINKTPSSLAYNAVNRNGMKNTGTIDTTTTINQFLALGQNDILNTAAGFLQNTNDNAYTNELSYRMNIEVPYTIGDKIVGYLKFGGKVRDIDRSNDHSNLEGSYKKDSSDPLSAYAVQRLPNYGWTYTLSNNWLGDQAFMPTQDVSALNQGQDFSMLGAKTYFYPDFSKVSYVESEIHDKLYPTLYGNSGDYKNKEHLYAAYIMSGIDIGKLITFTPGVRYEKNNYETTAKWLQETIRYGPIGTQGNMKDTTKGSGTEFFLPMINMKIKPTKWIDIRMAYTQTLTRPSFDRMSPKFYQSPTFERTYGDPYLKPQFNTNYDLYLSLYGKKLGLFTAGAFYKKMENQVLDYTETIIDPTKWGDAPHLSNSYKNKVFSYPINNPWAGYIKGLELDWQTHFSYLPKPFNGFILNSNVTFMQSQTSYPFYSWSKTKLDPFVFPFYKTVGGMTSRNGKIVGMPDVIANVAIGYEVGGFSGRISGYYQSRTRIQAKPSVLSTDVDKAALTRIDMQLSQKIRKIPGLSFYLNINNLTNNPDRLILTYYPSRIVSDEKYGTSGDIGVRYQF